MNLILNQPCPSLSSIFEDVIDNQGARQFCQNKKQIGFLTHTQEGITMLISKDDLKIRIQSNSFTCFWTPLNALIERLKSYFEHSDNNLEITLSDTIPLNELF